MWAKIPLSYLNSLGNNMAILRSNIRAKDFVGLNKICSHFLRRAIEAWLDGMKIATVDDVGTTQICHQNIWNNILIRYKNRPLFIPRWIQKGITSLGDLFQNDQWLSYNEVREIIGHSGGLLFEYNAIMNAIPLAWKTNGAEQISEPPNPDFHGKTISTWTSSFVRNKLTAIRYRQPGVINFWANKYPGLEISPRIWEVAFKCTKETRLRVLHFKIVHNIYPTKILLQKMGLADSSNCSYCNTRDYMEHFFYHCLTVRNLWTHIECKLSTFIGAPLELYERDIIFGITTGYNSRIRNCLNAYILVGKLCISKYKYGQYHDLLLLFQNEINMRKLKFQSEADD